MAATVTMVGTGGQVRKTLDAGLCPILCVGETREEYEAKLNKPVCALQLSKVAPFPSHSLTQSGARGTGGVARNSFLARASRRLGK